MVEICIRQRPHELAGPSKTFASGSARPITSTHNCLAKYEEYVNFLNLSHNYKSIVKCGKVSKGLRAWKYKSHAPRSSMELLIFTFFHHYFQHFTELSLIASNFTMAPIVFITGISGYIGGQVLNDMTEKHPEYQIRGLVRNEEQQKTVTAKYPSVQTIIGDLDATEILTAEAAKANVVLRASLLLYS
jgi:hypothetical protein